MIRLGIGLATMAMVVVGAGGLVLAWDGAWFILRTLQTGTPTFLHGRVAGAVIQVPALVLGQTTGDPGVATVATGLAYAAVPVIALVLTWRVTRPDRDDVLAIAGLGILVTALPGRAFLVSEAMLAVDLGWPLLAAAALGRVARHPSLVAGLAIAVALLHPFGLILVAAALGLAWLRWRRDGGEGATAAAPRAFLGLAVALIALGVLRSIVFATGYEAAALDPARLLDHVRGGLWPRPAVAVAAAFAAALAIALPGRGALAGTAVLRLVAILAVLGAAVVVLLPWAGDPARWERALQFRTLALGVQVPMVVLLAIAAGRAPADGGTSDGTDGTMGRRLPGATLVAAAVVALVVLTAQSLTWRGVVDRAVAAVEGTAPGCHAVDELALGRSALRHWGVTSLVLLAQSGTPSHLVLARDACPAVAGDAGPGLPVKVLEDAVADRVPVEGPLDLAPLAERLAGP